MVCKYKYRNLFVLLVFFNFLLAPVFASNIVTDSNIATINKYQPYFELGGARYFNKTSSVSGVYDLFIPLWQVDDQLLFTDIRIFGRSSGSSEGNFHLGYRKLYPATNQLIGIYGAFDCKKSIEGSVFNQLTLGFEYWYDKLFIGGNIYRPIGKTSFSEEIISKPVRETTENYIITRTTTNKLYEKALPGIDGELGYTITDNLTSYIGGYYFAGKNADTIAGPRVRLSYDYRKTHGRILGILDGVTVEAGMQHDKPRGDTWYLGLKFKVGLNDLKKNSNILDFERHMVELVRRDPDIVVGQAKIERIELKLIEPTNKNPKMQESSNSASDFSNWELKELLEKLDLPENATDAEINKTYRELVRKWHPDKVSDELKARAREIIHEFISIKAAIDSKRHRYTMSGTTENNVHDQQSISLVPALQQVKQLDCLDYIVTQIFSMLIPIKTVTALATTTPIDISNLDNVLKQYVEKKGGSSATDLVNVLNVVDRNSIELNETSIGYLQQIIVQDKDPRVLSAIAWTLTGSVVNYHQEPSHVTYLVDLAKSANIEPVIRENIINRFSKNIYEARLWSDNKIFNSFATLLPYDNDQHNLADALIKANKELRYTASIDIIPYFEKLLWETRLKEDVLQVIGNSLEKLLVVSSNSIFTEIQKHLDNLLYQAKRLPSNLVSGIFKIYSKDQSYFTDTIVNILAIDKYLSVDLLHMLIEPLELIKDPKVSLFMALRLVQNHVVLPRNILKYFIKFLYSEDEILRLSAIKFYCWLSKKNHEDLIADLIDALIIALPKVNGLSRINIINLLSEFKLNQDQKIKLNIQLQVSDWRIANSLQKKIDISIDLSDQITDKTAKILLPFLNETIFTQNTILLDIAKSIFLYEINQYQEQEASYFLNIIDGEIEKNEFVIEVAGGAKFLINEKQAASLQKQFEDIIWNIKEYIKHISFNDFKAIEEFLQFVKDNRLSEKELKQALVNLLSEVEVFDIEQLYNELLKNLLVDTKENSELVRSISRLVNQVQWPGDFLFSVIKQAEKTDLPALMAVLAKLNDYTIHPEMINRRGETAKMILEKKSFAEMLPALKQLITDNDFSIESDLVSFIEECKVLNKNNPEILALLNSNYFTDQLSRIEKFKTGELKIRGIAKPLAAWMEDDFKQWSRSGGILDNGDNIDEVIAVLSQAVYHTVFEKKYYPRPIQLIAVLALFESSCKGILEQIATGEGKSIIISMFALISAMQGRQVDIITSSAVLAERDTLKHRDFYNLFDIDVTHNTGRKKFGEARDCYKSPVVYGDIVNFNGDALRDDSANIRHNRAFDIVIIDEVDDPLVDRYNMKVQLSKEVPGFDVLSHIFIYMWGMSTNFRAMLQQKDDGCHFIMSVATDKASKDIQKIIPLEITDSEKDSLEYLVGDNCIDYFKDIITNYTIEKLFAFGHLPENRLFVVPHNLEHIAIKQLNNWIRSILLSFQYVEGVDYIISKETVDDFLQVTLVDKRGGVIQHKLHLSDGLHQFLDIENKLILMPESFVSTFMSYPGYFNRYNKIYGLSGTFGSDMYQSFLKDSYGVSLGIIPPFVPKNLVEFPPILTDNEVEQYRVIYNVITREIKGQRAALIVMKTIKQVKSLYEYFINQTDSSALRISMYGIGAKEEDEKLVRVKLLPSAIIIATYLAGRGTDLQLSQEVIKNHGLHVIQTEPSESGRASDQVDGRAARQGEPGSKQLVFNREDIKKRFKINCFDITDNECLVKVKEACDKNEAQILKQYKEKDLPYIQILDKIYNAYFRFVVEIDAPNDYKILVGKPKEGDRLKPFTLYLYADDAKIMLRVINDNVISDALKDDFDITELIKAIDPQVAKHINALNKQDREIIYFIADYQGYTKKSEIYTRVQCAFNEASNNKFKDLHEKNSAEPRKLFLFWLEDRVFYNKEYLLRQLEEKFGMWLRQQLDLLSLDDNSIDHNFDEFKNLVLTQMKEDRFMENPAYLVLESWRKLHIYYRQFLKVTSSYQNLVDAIAALEKARKLESVYSWTIDNALANILLVKDGLMLHTYQEDNEDHTLEKAYEVKSKYCEYAGHAIEKIGKLIEMCNAALTFLLSQKYVALTDDLAIQLIGKVTFYQKIVARIQKNIDLASRTSMDEMIRGKDIIDYEKLKTAALDHIITYYNFSSQQRPIINQISNQVLAQGGFIIELETYRLEKVEKSNVGTVVAAMMGAVFICVGMLLAPFGGVFLQTFAISLISKGVGDIILALQATATGNHIDFNDYIYSSGISLGMSIAVSGMLFFLDKIQIVHSLGFAHKLAGVAKRIQDNPIGVLGVTSLMHASSVALSSMLSKMGNKFIDENNIHDEAQAAIAEVMNAPEVHEALKNIFVTDAINGNNELINVLYKRIEKVIHDDGIAFGVGVGIDAAGQLADKFENIGNIIEISNLIKTGTKLAIGGIKNAKLLGNIVNDVRMVIKNTATMSLKKGAMMDRVLVNAFGIDISNKLVGALNSQGYIANGEINYLDCDSLSSIQLDETLVRYKPGVVEACIVIQNLLFKEYQAANDALKNDIVNRITRTVSTSQKQTIVQPIVDAVAIEGGARIGSGLYNYLNKKFGETITATHANYDQYRQKPAIEKATKEAIIHASDTAGQNSLGTFKDRKNYQVIAMLASAAAYDDGANSLTQLKSMGFEKFGEPYEDAHGYHGSAYIKKVGAGRDIIIINNRGTSRFERNNHRTWIPFLRDADDDLQLFFGMIPGQQKSALVYAKNIIKAAGPNAEILFVGHSLGGVLSQRTAIAIGKDAIVFDCPRIKGAYGLSKIMFFNSIPNIVNFNIGELRHKQSDNLELITVYRKSDLCFKCRFLGNLKLHGINEFLKVYSLDGALNPGYIELRTKSMPHTVDLYAGQVGYNNILRSQWFWQFKHNYFDKTVIPELPPTINFRMAFPTYTSYATAFIKLSSRNKKCCH